MSAWLAWVIAGILLILFELLFSGFVLICFGVAALGTALVAALGIGLPGQLLVFIVLTVVAFVTIRPFFLKHMHERGGAEETNVLGLVGKTGRVTEAVGPGEERGRVKVGGEEWRAMHEGEGVLAAGCAVRITGVSGNTLTIEPL